MRSHPQTKRSETLAQMGVPYNNVLLGVGYASAERELAFGKGEHVSPFLR